MHLKDNSFWQEIWHVCAWAGERDPSQPEGMVRIEVEGFPQKQIEQIYQTADDGTLLPRTQLLVKWVFARFGPTAVVENLPQPTEVAGAYRLLDAILDAKSLVLSAIDRVRLLGAMGMLCRSRTDGAVREDRQRWQEKGLSALRTAVALDENLPPPFRRHLHWLMADTLIGAVKDDGLMLNSVNEDEALEHLIEACRGDVASATTGLYFSCISRLFTLSPASRERFCDSLLGELRRAWCSLSPATMKADQQKAFTTLPLADLREKYETMLDWHVEDRFAVCTLLAWNEYRGGRTDLSSIYAYEACRLRPKLSKTRLYRRDEPTVEIHHVRQLLRSAEAMSIVPMHILRDISISQTGGDEAMRCIEVGDMAGAERALKAEARQAEFIERQLCRLKMAELWGDANDAEKERQMAFDVLQACEGNEVRDHACVRAEAYRVLARNAANTGTALDATALLGQAQEAVGAAAWPQLMLVIQRYAFIYHQNTHTPLSNLSVMGQFVWASFLWERTEWIEGNYGANLSGFTRKIGHAVRPDAWDPRAFKRWVDDLPRDAKPKAVMELVKTAFDIRPGALVGPWVSGMVNLYMGKVSHLPPSRKDSAFAHIDKCGAHLADLVENGLARSRADDFRERLAMVLCQWLKNLCASDAPPQFIIEAKSHVLRAMKCAVQIAQQRIARQTTRPHRNAARKRLRSLVQNLSEAKCLLDWNGSLTGILDECKTNDADTWYLVKAEPEVEIPFEDISETLPLNNCVSEKQEAHASASPQRDRAVLSFFMPANGSRDNDLAAFAVLKYPKASLLTNCDNERVFALPNAHEAIKLLVKAVDRALKQNAQDMGLSTAVEAMPLHSSQENDKPKNAAPNPAPAISPPNLLTRIKPLLTPEAREYFNSPTLNAHIDVAELALTKLGEALLPPTLVESLRGIQELIIVPDGKLFLVPLHLLPYSSKGDTLLGTGITVSYKPRADYCAAPRESSPSDDMVACLNTEDAKWSESPGFNTLVKNCGESNLWDKSMCAEQLLARMANAKRSIVCAHGHADQHQELNSRIELKGGQCLSTLDMSVSRQDFSGSQIYLFSCHSMPQKIGTARELLGPAGAFLTLGVGCVSASIWECDIPDAVLIAASIAEIKPPLDGVSKVWSDVLRAISVGIATPFQRFARLGCFMLYDGV